MIDPNFHQIPPGVSVLMIVHPTSLSNSQLYAIDQYVLGGGRALIFVDPFSSLLSRQPEWNRQAFRRYRQTCRRCSRRGAFLRSREGDCR